MALPTILITDKEGKIYLQWRWCNLRRLPVWFLCKSEIATERINTSRCRRGQDAAAPPPPPRVSVALSPRPKCQPPPRCVSAACLGLGDVRGPLFGLGHFMGAMAAMAVCSRACRCAFVWGNICICVRMALCWGVYLCLGLCIFTCVYARFAHARISTCMYASVYVCTYGCVCISPACTHCILENMALNPSNICEAIFKCSGETRSDRRLTH